ncbi:PREDICTED: E3 ubiquitin protein ligase DRIP2-like [Fragaria vesca subsp. vesca]|uniref:E3 ubiquitin protein ligase DRIP2-like n=1 Tax=Fragaria vesca subsp. vesca TaxID=101020 RepID=UPI0002C36BD7|nr:PREDICTED: E3 ubiquitin protein ligase DRIP2-like [Fragaria vesca subsp. vesca]
MCVLRLGIESEMAGHVVKVKREALVACMTCPLCHKLLKEATTISLCLHTFCRKCILEKLSDEEGDCCPVCEIDLGCMPVEKLRPDHNLQDIRAKIFPLKRRKINAPESPSVTLPVKRKERSLSSLVVSTRKVPVQAGLTGKRSRALTRKAAALRECSFSVEGTSKREDSSEDHPRSSSSPDAQDKMQDSSMPENSYEQKPKKDDVEVIEGKADLWTPLNCLVEAANRTKSSKSNPQGQLPAKSEPLNALDSISELYMPENNTDAESPDALESHVHVPKVKIKEPENSTRGKKNINAAAVTGSMKRKRFHAGNRNRGAPSVESGDSTQDVRGAKHNRRNNPIWFSLVAAENWKGEASLPQISSCYLRIKDGKMPVTFIQKYLVKKLELTSEAEVEIMCRGQPVHPTLQLHNLVDLWFRNGSTTKKLPATVGSSAKDFVMVLSYCRSVQNP